VADRGAQQLHIVAFDGTVRARQGARGYGSDEYMNLDGLARYGDGLVAWDGFHLRLTRLDSDGRRLGDVSFRGRAPTYHRSALAGTFGNSAMLEFHPTGYNGPSNEPTRVRENVTFLVAGVEDGAVLHTLILPGEELLAMRQENVHGGLPVLFGRHSTSAVTPAGAWLADTDQPRLVHYRADGALCSVDFAHLPSSVHDAWVEHARDSVAAAIAHGQGYTSRIQEFRRDVFSAGLPSQSTLPFFSALRGGEDGTLWIRSSPVPGEEEVTWIALDGSLQAAARLRLPGRVRVLDFQGNRLLTLEEGADGGERLVVYALER
jgi:hypothetical protein